MRICTIACLITLLASCNTKNGIIENRMDQAYLVNKSFEESFLFTIQTKSIKNNSIIQYHTNIIELAPGDEILIGCYSDSSVKTYHKIEKQEIEIVTSENIKEIKKNPFLLGLGHNINHQLGDTIINNIRTKYRLTTHLIDDTLNPYPIDRYKFIYTITGQQKVKKLITEPNIKINNNYIDTSVR